MLKYIYEKILITKIVKYECVEKGRERIGVEAQKTIPDSIYKYLENTIWRAIKDGKIEKRIVTIAILRYMLDMPGYAIDEEILYPI